MGLIITKRLRNTTNTPGPPVRVECFVLFNLCFQILIFELCYQILNVFVYEHSQAYLADADTYKFQVVFSCQKIQEKGTILWGMVMVRSNFYSTDISRGHFLFFNGVFFIFQMHYFIFHRSKCTKCSN